MKKVGGGPILSHFSAILGLRKLLQVFDISRGKKTIFFKNCPNNGLLSKKKYIVFFFTVGGGGLDQTVKNFTLFFFFFKASLKRNKILIQWQQGWSWAACYTKSIFLSKLIHTNFEHNCMHWPCWQSRLGLFIWCSF